MKKNDIDVVDYETFYNELSSDKKREDAPPKSIPLFGLVNEFTNNPRLVLNIPFVTKKDIDFAYHMLKHENIHVVQKNRSGGRYGEYLGDIRDAKKYFSYKNEIMAFSQSIADILLMRYPDEIRNIEDAMKSLDTVWIWNSVKRSVDEKTLKRYKKYIYLYLEMGIDKLNK